LTIRQGDDVSRRRHFVGTLASSVLRLSRPPTEPENAAITCEEDDHTTIIRATPGGERHDGPLRARQRSHACRGGHGPSFNSCSILRLTCQSASEI
jgi:hypothetical protein